MKTLATFLLLILLLEDQCVGSEELPLPLASVDVRGLSEIAGGVRIQIASPKWGIESVKIFAFGRDIVIPDAELAKLIGAAYSEVSISCDGGYKEAGGTTIYITLCFTDMFEGDPFKGDPMLQQRIRIAVSDSMPVRVTKE